MTEIITQFLEYKFYIFTIFLTSLFLLETFFPFRKFQEKRKTHIFRNFSFTIFNYIILTFSYGIILFMSTNFVQKNNLGFFNQEIITQNISEISQWIILYLIFDITLYFWHKISHENHFLWKFHQVHHSDNILDFSSATRFHALELFISGLVKISFIFIFGVSFIQILLFEFITIIFAQFNHSNFILPKKFEKYFRIIFVSPNMHQIHHSIKVKETNSNYSTVFSFWDRIFGTFRTSNNLKEIKIGLTQYNTQEDITFIKLIKMPFKK